LRKLIVWAGLLTASNVTPLDRQVPQSKYQNDPRLARLTTFFASLDSPVADLSEDFLTAADRHNLDWRLLPSISVVESSAGKAFTRNNIFGWDSARHGFASVRDGIYWVASRIAHSNLYKGKNLDEVLTTYNPRADYAARVKGVMRQVDPREPLSARGVQQVHLTRVSALQGTGRRTPAN
jgi:hypothetical protein